MIVLNTFLAELNKHKKIQASVQFVDKIILKFGGKMVSPDFYIDNTGFHENF